MYTLTFSHVVNGKRIPLFVDGIEHTMQVEAVSKSDAIYRPEVKTFCDGRNDDTRVRHVRGG